VHLGPQGAETLALGDAPTGIASGLGVGSADVDVDSADLERPRAVEWKDTAVASFELGISNAANPKDSE
jgi:hypothetical protein